MAIFFFNFSTYCVFTSSVQVNTNFRGGPWGCCFIFPFFLGTHGNVFEA